MPAMRCATCAIVMLGVTAHVTADTSKLIDGERFSAKTIYEDRFEQLSPIWVLEGKPAVRAKHGKLHVDASGEGPGRYATLWLNKELPSNVLIEYHARCPRQQTTAANLNQFLMACEADGADILSIQHSGDYKDYHSLPLYIITLTYKWSRLRKCPGFECVSERMDVRSGNEVRYRIRILKTGDRIRYFINDAKVHDWTDTAGSYTSGKFGLRTWSTVVEYDNFRVYDVRDGAG